MSNSRRKTGVYRFILKKLILVIVFSLLISGILSTLIITQDIRKEKIKESKEIAEITFNIMYQIMLKGATKEDIIHIADKVSSNELQYRVIYRSIREIDINHPGIKEALEKLSPYKAIKNGIIHFNYPIVIRKECTNCHKNKVGFPLGIIEVEYAIDKLVGQTSKSVYFGILTSNVIVGILTLIFVYIALGKLQDLLELLKDISQEIRDYSDIKVIKGKLESYLTKNKTFEEIDRIARNIINLIDNIEKVSTSKSILETQVKLLEKFIITSELIRDWKDYIEYFISEANKIVNICVLFSIFFSEDKSLEAEVFWVNTPTEETKRKLESYIKNEVKTNFDEFAIVKFTHNISDSSTTREIHEEQLHFRTKKMTSKKPIIGGIVGIGVTLNEVDPIKEIAMEMVLSSLMNLVGSVKALYKYTKEIEFYATRDPLTQVYNQRMLLELVNIEIEKCKRTNSKFSMLLIDIDNFKFINDHWGYEVGDMVLQEVTSIVKENTRQSDIIARYSADEICVVLPETDIEQAKFVAERIKEEIGNKTFITPKGSILHITVTTVIVTYPTHFVKTEEGFKLIFNVLHRAKEVGGDRIITPFEDDIEEILLSMGEKTQLLIKTIETKSVIPFWQPILDLKTDEIVGAELLMRIKKPDGSIVAASEFIELAETTGLINRLDMINLEKAFEQIEKTNYNKLIFINVSPKILVMGEFINYLKDLISNHKINPQNVIIELTERETIKNINLIGKLVRSLRNMNVRFCIDDFGTGYSSMKYMKIIPVDIIKIDGTFILGLAKNEKIEVAVVKSIVSLAEHLDVITIAEYIESEELLKICKEMGINYGQGFYIGKPSPELPS
ncbi:MAG: putative bifunctional diguanylate cyclase/phosphodiesterase [Thermosulfidibacteraceae bacterium]